jgi:hypothetical protein
MISTHLYLYKDVLTEMDIYFSKKGKEKPKHIKPINLSNYSNMMKIKHFEDAIIEMKSEQIMIKKEYFANNIIFYIHISHFVVMF